MLIHLPNLIKKYDIQPKGLIHVGAHMAEEAEIYNHCGFIDVLWIEGNPELLPFLKTKLSSYSSHRVLEALIDKEEKEVVFNITNDSQSSSVFALKEHLQQYPSVTLKKQVKLKTKNLSNVFSENNIILEKYNFLNIDIQGNELSALKSCGDTLKYFDYIYTEIQIAQLYENSPTLVELDKFLVTQGFKRKEMNLSYHSWGDAFYIREKSSFFRASLITLLNNLLVSSWPMRKKIYRLNAQLGYYGKKLINKKH